jgi:hypothetical protein
MFSQWNIHNGYSCNSNTPGISPTKLQGGPRRQQHQRQQQQHIPQDQRFASTNSTLQVQRLHDTTQTHTLTTTTHQLSTISKA